MKKIYGSLLVFFALAGAIGATPLIDFGIGPVNPGAGITYAGGFNPLFITNVPVLTATGVDTPLHTDESVTCSGCLLDLATGSFTGSSSVGGQQFWFFGANMSSMAFTITGMVPGIVDLTDVLVSGTVESTTVIRNGHSTVIASFQANHLNPLLVSYFGMPDSQYDGFLNLAALLTVGSGNNIVASTVASANQSNVPGVPEPGSHGLMGAGLLGIMGFLRYKRA